MCLPLKLVLANTALNDFFYLRIVYFVKTGRLDTLQKGFECQIVKYAADYHNMPYFVHTLLKVHWTTPCVRIKAQHKLVNSPNNNLQIKSHIKTYTSDFAVDLCSILAF